MFYVVGFLCFVTGHFKDFVFFTAIILFHELGHILMACHFKWHIEKVILLPFGGITIFKEHLNKPILEEFWIAITGPIFQASLFLIIKDPVFMRYSLGLLGFNLLPIVPLDGSKIVNLLCNKIFPYKKSLRITLSISCFSIVFFLLKIRHDLCYLFIFFFLLVEIYKQYVKMDYLFHKFLLERYLYSIPLKREKVVQKTSQMMREYRHLFYIGEKYYTEREILRKMFDNSSKTC